MINTKKLAAGPNAQENPAWLVAILDELECDRTSAQVTHAPDDDEEPVTKDKVLAHVDLTSIDRGKKALRQCHAPCGSHGHICL